MKQLFTTNAELLKENAFLKQRLKELEKSESKRRRADAERCESEEEYRSMFENAVEGMFQTTPDGRFLTVNPAYAIDVRWI